MSVLRLFNGLHLTRNLTRLKLVLLLCFSILLLFQIMLGFNSFEDYLVVFIFVLFLNDLFLKIKSPQSIEIENGRTDRMIMSLVFLVMLGLPFVFDSLNVSNESRLTLYKLGFVLWSQIFLLDSFYHYKETQSKQWLVFANLAVLMIIIGAFY